ATGNPPAISTTGGDSTVGLRIVPKSTGNVLIGNGGKVVVTSTGGGLSGTFTPMDMDNGFTPLMQVVGNTTNGSSLGVFRAENDVNGPVVYVGKSRGNNVIDYTIVQDQDKLGAFVVSGA